MIEWKLSKWSNEWDGSHDQVFELNHTVKLGIIRYNTKVKSVSVVYIVYGFDAPIQ